MADKVYRLRVPQVLHDELQDLAERMEMSLQELLQRFIKIGLTIHKAGFSDDEKIFIRSRDGEEQEITLL